LEGMANHQRRALFELTGNMLLYAPACKQEEFINAIGYLVRRMDENTGPNNFLRHAFNIQVDSEDWHALEEQFVSAYRSIESVSTEPRRTQDRRRPIAASSTGGRNAEQGAPPNRAGGYGQFQNEPDTDWSLPQNGEWAQKIVASWKDCRDDRAIEVPLVVGGHEIFDKRDVRESIDPSRPGAIVARYRQANNDDIDRAVRVAREDSEGWRRRTVEERVATLHQAAYAI